jgi:hypothetical protein
MVLENFPFALATGIPALFGLIGLATFAYFFKRPYIAIAGGILGTLLGIGITST